MAENACSSCGKALALADVLYNEQGNVVCVECSSKAAIRGDEARAAKNIKAAAVTCLVAAVAGFCAFGVGFGLGFWPAAIASVAGGLYAINAIAGAGSERFVAYLTNTDKTVIWICCAIGLSIGAFEILVFGGVIKFHLWVR